MTSEKIERVAKLLSLSTSDNAPEALQAVRTANAILKKENVSWSDLLLLPIAQESREKEQDERDAYEPSVGDMISFLKTQYLNHWATGFIFSVAQQYGEWGALSPKQLNCLRKLYHQHYR